jgi:D-alanine-D-alanine ligase
VGISKVTNKMEFGGALREAFRYDNKVLLEEGILGREIECSVLGNEKPIASLPGEIITRHEFYSYDAKYLDEKGARLIVPARLPKTVVKRIQELAIRTFKVLCCEGERHLIFPPHRPADSSRPGAVSQRKEFKNFGLVPISEFEDT